jgi:hypothetical protein
MVCAAQATTLKVPLQKLTALPSIDLKCVNGSESMSIPLPQRWDIHSMVLTLRYSVSNNLIGDVSQLVVKVNDAPVAQTKLSPQAPNAEVTIDVPLELLRPGYNTLTFQVAQHFSRQVCEPPCSPDLWTNISVNDSFLELDYDLKPVPLTLGAATTMIFDNTQFPSGAVHIVTEKLDTGTATLAAVVASGIARRFDFREVDFSVSREVKPGVDNVLIGSNAFANKILAPGGASVAEGNGGLLKVFHLPRKEGGWDERHALLLLADDKKAALKVTAETLANMSLPFPDAQELRAIAFTVPDVSMYSGRRVLASDKPYDFKTLDLPTYTFRGLNATPAELSFRLPADFLIKQNQFAKLSLNFSYGAGMRNNSALNIAINGRELRAVHLDSVSGNFIDGYKVDIPTYAFKPGANTISFTPMLNPPGAICDLQTFDGMFVTIYGNSTLYFPPMPHFVELPKIELFALNGFPFTRWPDGFETRIYLPEPSDATLAAALDIVTMISQRNGFPLFGTEVVFNEPRNWGGELIVVGRAAAIPPRFMAAAPLKLLSMADVPYPTIRSWNAETQVAYSKQKSSLGNDVGVLMEFESLYKKGRSVLMFTAQSDAGVAALGKAMLDPGVQGGITGDLVFVNLADPKYPVTSLRVGKPYTTGNKGDSSAIESFLYTNPYIFYGVAVSAVLGLAWLLFWRLRVFRAKRAGAPPPPKT